MNSIRFERLFNRNERAVIIAMDHCEFSGPIPGLENLSETASKIASCVDGILLSPAMLVHCSHAFNYKGAPISVVRLNWSTVYCYQWNYKNAVTVEAFSAAESVRLGADVALISLTLQTGNEANDAHNVEVFRRLCNDAKQLGMPVIGEYYPVMPEQLTPEELHENVMVSTRIIAELGADLIKTFYTHNFKAVTDSCPVPVFGLGGEKCPTQVGALQLAADEVAGGAGGVVFGRNAFQVPDPAAFQHALCEVVKHKMKPEDAVKKFKLHD